MARTRDEWKTVALQLEALTGDDVTWLSLLANASALLQAELADINWVGFYLLDAYVGAGDATELVLGPFQGKVACMRIGRGKGVCGHAAQLGETVVVDDVHAFPGHIACDSASRSEVVVPLWAGGRVIGVLDVDSPHEARFDADTVWGLELAARALEGGLPATLNRP